MKTSGTFVTDTFHKIFELLDRIMKYSDYLNYFSPENLHDYYQITSRDEEKLTTIHRR